MSTPPGAAGGPDLAALQAVTDAVRSGAGLPEVVRAASRALDASVVVSDRSGSVLAVAARSPADERSLLAGGEDVEVVELRVGDEPVGSLRLRQREPAHEAIRTVVATLVASEVERVRAPERASQAAVGAFVADALSGELTGEELAGRARDLGLDLAGGVSVVVARAHAHVPTEEGWRARVLALAERGARAACPGAVAALVERPGAGAAEAHVVVPGEDGTVRRCTEEIVRELQSGLPGHSFAVGRSRVASDPAELPRAGNEALLAANVAEGDADRPVLAFDETGAYRLLLSAMSEDPGELQRFYSETVEPLVVYDEQYATDLVRTVEAYLDADGNVAATASRLFTHRHTIRYRLERVRELSGLDVGSSDGRERLSLGLKAMRVLGIAGPRGPGREEPGDAGRLPRPGG